jgi:uncharacterized protein
MRVLPADLARPLRYSAAAPELIAVALVGLHNHLLNKAWPRHMHVPVNVAIGLGALVAARQAGVPLQQLGLEATATVRGVKYGATAAGLAAAGVTAAAALTPTQRFFVTSGGVSCPSARAMAYETLVRTPFGIAAPEEALFRGMLLGLLLQRRTVLPAVGWSSLLFGWWHVHPTLRSLSDSPMDRLVSNPRSARAAAVAVAVATTTAAGAVFGWLRVRSGSLVAPVLAHIAINNAGYVAACLVSRRQPASVRSSR